MNSANAVVYCEGSFATTYGKTAHGLVRFTERYNIVCVIDSTLTGTDALEYLDGKKSGIMLVKDLAEAVEFANAKNIKLTHFIIGIATDGGFLEKPVKEAAIQAMSYGLHIDSGLHEFISDLEEAKKYVKSHLVKIHDIRKPSTKRMHAFTGKINDVKATRIAMMGTDSAIGKRTTSWILVHALIAAGKKAELIGTGQTAWLQGAKYGIILDSLLNDYISGELEHALWSAWNDTKMDFAIIEGQGSLMNPGYPGGFEILAAGRPDGIIMQHAPYRKEYDGFPGYPMDSLNDQIHIAEFLSKKPVVAITINHEGIPSNKIDTVCKEVEQECGRPTIDPLIHGVDSLVPLLLDLKK